MFAVYFGILPDLIPPTVTSARATSSIAGADVRRPPWTAMLLAPSSFIIPFSFGYDPVLLVPGVGLIGSLRAPTLCWDCAGLLAGTFLLIFPGALSDAAGAGCSVALLAAQRRRCARGRYLSESISA
jgi:TRAP-type uncharacterized transport system fused permease subunit